MQFITATVTPRHGRTDKPAGREALVLDRHNPSKAHHIILTADGETYYNQAILARRKDEWCDFYEWELVGCMEQHGYREYIDAAVIRIRQPRKPLLKRIAEARRKAHHNCKRDGNYAFGRGWDVRFKTSENGDPEVAHYGETPQPSKMVLRDLLKFGHIPSDAVEMWIEGSYECWDTFEDYANPPCAPELYWWEVPFNADDLKRGN